MSLATASGRATIGRGRVHERRTVRPGGVFMQSYEFEAKNTAQYASEREGEEAISEGLAAIAFALLEVASAIRENTEARR